MYFIYTRILHTHRHTHIHARARVYTSKYIYMFFMIAMCAIIKDEMGHIQGNTVKSTRHVVLNSAGKQ